jgi:hypothetical protein
VTGDEARLADAVAAASRIALRLRRSEARFAPVFPLRAADVAAFDEADQEASDALLKRIENLIAHLQDQVWRRVALAEQVTLRLGSRRELAEHMQRFGLLPAGETFKTAAELRNRLSHEYPTEPARQAALLNDALATAPLLLDCVARAEAYLARRGG